MCTKDDVVDSRMATPRPADMLPPAAGGWGTASVGGSWTVVSGVGSADFCTDLPPELKVRFSVDVGSFMAGIRRARRAVQRWQLRAAFQRKVQLRRAMSDSWYKDDPFQETDGQILLREFLGRRDNHGWPIIDETYRFVGLAQVVPPAGRQLRGKADQAW